MHSNKLLSRILLCRTDDQLKVTVNSVKGQRVKQRHVVNFEPVFLFRLVLFALSVCTVMSIQMRILSVVHTQTFVNQLVVNVYFISCALVLLLSL